MCSRIFKNKSGTFSFNLKTLHKTKTFWCVPDFFFYFFLQVFLQPLLALSWPLLHSHDLNWHSQGPLPALSWPLQHLKAASINTHYHGLYWHSHGLYKHYQGLRSLQTLSWLVIDNSLEISHGCESVVEASLSQPL